MEDDKMKDDQNGRRPKWKTTKIEDNQNGRRSKWKTPKMEDDQNGTLVENNILHNNKIIKMESFGIIIFLKFYFIK